MPAIPIDEAELQSRVESVFPGLSVDKLSRLKGGTSSITYWTTIERGATTDKVVVKVAPAGLEPVRNRDVLRQAKVLAALARTDVPVPDVLGADPGAGLEIPPFFVMSFEAGDCLEPNGLASPLPAQEVRGRELDAARIMGILHRTEPGAVGLGDEPVKSLAEEAQVWINMFAACDEDLREGHEEVGARLVETVPEQGPTTLIHGDFRLGNTLSEGTRVVAVIDWEIWARSDARVDLAWFLMMANRDAALGGNVAEGMPSNEELRDTYEKARGASVDDLGWFEALVRYKQAAAAAFITRNARRRGEESTAASGNPALFRSARALLDMD